jgi:hypothetical protein
MAESVDIKGGAGPFEAAVVAAVIDYVIESERKAMQRPPNGSNRPPAWVRALQPRNPEDPLNIVRPDHCGDPL